MWTCQVLGHHDTKAVHRKNTEQQKTTRRTEHQDATDIQKTHTHYFKCFSDFVLPLHGFYSVRRRLAAEIHDPDQSDN